MKYLLGEMGKKKLASFLEEPILLGLDFDGTLAPMTAYRELARMRPPTKRLFEALVSEVPVAVISGRAVEDLRRVVEVKPKFLVGNHGLEGIRAFGPSLLQAKADAQKWATVLKKKLTIPGSDLEDKKFSLTLHYRNCADPKSAAQAMVKLGKGLTPRARVLLGDHVVNLTGKKSPHKGHAILHLMKTAKVRRAIYVGDDYTDEDIFSLKSESIFGIRIGKSSQSKADWYLRDQMEIDDFLKYFTVQLRAK